VVPRSRTIGSAAIGSVVVLALATLTYAETASRAAPTPPYVLKRIARSFQQPVYVTTAPGDPTRLFVVLRQGAIRVLRGGRLEPTPFLDIRRRVQTGGEMGLLSIAFHPDYQANGLVYTAFNDEGDGQPVTVAEYRTTGGRIDPASERILVRVPHPNSPYHNGGQLQFGPDGRLYVGVGDGGYTQGRTALIPDPNGNAQNLGVLLGKIFRLDVAAPSPAPEIVAFGLRNPWRFAFAPNGDMIIGDVGWNTAEEVDVLPSAAGLVNFGWSVYEGRRKRPNAGELNSAGRLTGPVLTYATGTRRNCSIVGGYVYRGHAVARLRGRYVFGDYCSGRIWSVRISNGRASNLRLEPVKVPNLDSFGEDGAGELYAISFSGGIYRFAAR
jgi:glucose/arabinose dehydrogenase